MKRSASRSVCAPGVCGSACDCKCNVLTNVVAELNKLCSDAKLLPSFVTKVKVICLTNYQCESPCLKLLVTTLIIWPTKSKPELLMHESVFSAGQQG